MAGTDSSSGLQISNQDVYQRQEPFLQDLWQNAKNLYANEQAKTGQTQGQLSDILSQIGNVSTGTPKAAGDFAENLIGGNTQGQQTLMGLMNPQGNPYLDRMVDASSRGLIQNYQENVIPGITGAATAAGHYGSSRQGIAQGIAARGLTDSLQDVSTNLYGGQYQADQNRALQAAGQYTGGQQAGAGILSSLSGQRFGQRMSQLQSLLGGYAQLPQVPWAPLNAYAGAVGGPAVLQDSVQQNSSSGFNIL